MKRLIWVSVLLVLAGLFMPLAFLADGEGYETGESESPAPSESESPPPEEKPQALYGEDSDFRISFLSGGSVTSLSMEEYLPCALAAEMPVSFEPEALRAQAVAARTYVVYCTEHANSKHPEADVCDQYSCCLAYADESTLRGNWGENFADNMALIRAACADTDGRIITYEDSAILATFHSSSAGKTQAGVELWGDVPYLLNVDSPETAEDAPNFVSTVEVTPENFKESVLLLRPETSFGEDPALWVEGFEPDESGRVRYMTICGQSLSGPEMRKLFSLRSAAFTLEYSGEAFVFTVTGYGHGLGLSQYGANVMAKSGAGYEEILEHYYPNTALK